MSRAGGLIFGRGTLVGVHSDLPKSDDAHWVIAVTTFVDIDDFLRLFPGQLCRYCGTFGGDVLTFSSAKVALFAYWCSHPDEAGCCLAVSAGEGNCHACVPNDQVLARAAPRNDRSHIIP